MFDPLGQKLLGFIKVYCLRNDAALHKAVLSISNPSPGTAFYAYNKREVQYKKNPQIISYLLTNFIWSMIMQ